jgi:hypothetical protein
MRPRGKAASADLIVDIGPLWHLGNKFPTYFSHFHHQQAIQFDNKKIDSYITICNIYIYFILWVCGQNFAYYGVRGAMQDGSCPIEAIPTNQRGEVGEA